MLIEEKDINNSIETYIDNLSQKSIAIYLITICFIFFGLISLHFIYVDVTCDELGRVRPIQEFVEITSPYGEFIDHINISEGQKVEKGQLLLTLKSSAKTDDISYNQYLLKDINNHIEDLNALINNKIHNTLKTQIRRQESSLFNKQCHELQLSLNHSYQEYSRHKELFDKGLISLSEFETFLYDYNIKKGELETLKQNQHKYWVSELNVYENKNNLSLRS